MTQRVFVPTDEQEAILNGFLEAVKQSFPPENLAIDAGAGTGKSRTLLYLVEMLLATGYAKSIMMLAFNRSIKLELEAKLKAAGFKNVSAKTFNGLGFAAFLKNYQVKDADREVWIDKNKYKRIARYLVERRLPVHQRSADEIAEAAEMLQKLFEFFRVNTTKHHRTGDLCIFMGGNLYDEESLVPYEPGNTETIRAIASRYNLWLNHPEDEATLWGLIPEMLRLGKLGYEDPTATRNFFSEARFADRLDGLKRWCDFGDQVHGTVVEKWMCWGSSIIMVDEAQDTSPLDRALIDMHRWQKDGKKFGRVVMVGDPQQAIYRFRGADGDGFANSMRFWFIKKAFPLSLSYRVPQVIARVAAEHKPGYRAHESNVEGEIATVNERDLVMLAQDGDLVVSRVRASLIIYRNLIMKAGKAARILGSDMTESIVNMLTTVSEMEGYRWRNTIEFLEKFRDHKLEIMVQRKKSEEVQERFLDDVATVIAIVQALPDNIASLDAAIEQIERDFDPANQPEGGIVVATGHVVKGMEFKRVFNVTPDRFPMVLQNQSHEEYVQELNLLYVVRTRTIESYYEVDPKAPSYFEDNDSKLMLETASASGEKTLVEIPNVPMQALPAAVQAPVSSEKDDDMPWCEWCGNYLSAPGVPCKSCQQLGASADNHPSVHRDIVLQSPPPPVALASVSVEPPPLPPVPVEPADKPSWAQKLLAGAFVVLDFETTSAAGEPVQIAVIDHTGQKLMSTLVKPIKNRIDRQATDIHGIMLSTVHNSPTFEALYPQFRALLENKIVIAYNAQFERKTLEYTCNLYGLDMPPGIRWECAMLSFAAHNKSRWKKLTEACSIMGVSVEGEAHDALVDVRLTLELIKAMAGTQKPQVVPLEPPQPVSTPSTTPPEPPALTTIVPKPAAPAPKANSLGSIEIKPIQPRPMEPQRRARMKAQISTLEKVEDIDALLEILLERRAELVGVQS